MINILHHIYRKKEYRLLKTRIFIIIFLLLLLILIVFTTPLFLLTDSKELMVLEKNYWVGTLFFNGSMIFFFSSIILFSFSFIKPKNNSYNLPKPSNTDLKKGTINLGTIMNKKKKKFYISLKDLEKHVFICGATGTGKTNFLQYFILNLIKVHQIPFFLVEFKGEYRFLQKKIKNMLILWPGENFSINIFNPENTDPLIHAERIFDILKSGKLLDENSDFSPQMEKVLVEILVKVCSNKEYQSWEGFERTCEEYVRKNISEIPMLKQTIISIKNRIRRFSKGPLKALFDKNIQFEVKKLFKCNILLDLSSIIRLGGEKEDALFFLNLILKYLWDRNLTRGGSNYSGIKHITIIEDAQYFASQDLVKKGRLTTYLEDIALLQRGTGECLITLATRPDISEEILANCGVLISFKNHMERSLLCKLLNLNLENEDYLSMLEEGQCLIRVNSIKQPFLLYIPQIKREKITISEILDNNNSIQKNEYIELPQIRKKCLKLKKIIKLMLKKISSKFFKNKFQPSKSNNNINNELITYPKEKNQIEEIKIVKNNLENSNNEHFSNIYTLNNENGRIEFKKSIKKKNVNELREFATYINELIEFQKKNKQNF